MALEIFKLVGSVFVDTDKANDSLKKVDNNASKVADGFTKAGKIAGGVGIAIGTAMVGAGTAVVNMANDTSEMADEIDKMSQKTGLSIEGFQEWNYIMDQNGMSIDSMQSGMKTLVGQMDKVKSGNQSAIDTFKSLGVEVLNADGTLRDQEDVMNDTIMALADMGDTAERAKLQTELFGKAGTELSPMLNQGSDAIEDLRDRSHELNLIMSEDAVKSGVAYGDLKDDLEKSSAAIKNSIGSAVMPILNKLLEKFIEFLPTIQSLADRIGPLAAEFIDKLLPPLFEIAEEVLPILMDAAQDILPSLAEIAEILIPVIVSLLQELLPVIIQIVSDILPVVVDIIKKMAPILAQIMEFLGPILEMVMQLISPLLDLVMQILSPILELITALLGPILELLTNVLTPIFGIIQAILGPLTSLLGAILEPLCDLLMILLEPLIELLNMILPPLISIIEGFFQWAGPVLTQMFEWLGMFFQFIVDGLGKNGLTGAFKAFGDFFKGLWNGITNVFKSAVNLIIKGINGLIGGLNKMKPPQWLTDLTGITGVNIPTIPLLARGGDIEAAGRVIVGERGPEMLDLPRGARVTPLDNSGIDYERITEAFVTALRLVAPELASNVVVSEDKDRLIKVLVRENKYKKSMDGRGLFE